MYLDKNKLLFKVKLSVPYIDQILMIHWTVGLDQKSRLPLHDEVCSTAGSLEHLAKILYQIWEKTRKK